MFQSTLTAGAEVQTGEKFALQNGKMLKATLGSASGMREFYARAGAMVAYQGGVNFDGHWQGWGARFRQLFSQGEGLNLMKVSGSGTVYLANQAQDVHILDLTGDGLSIDGKNVLAFEESLRWDIVRVDSQVQIAGAGNYQVELHRDRQGRRHNDGCSARYARRPVELLLRRRGRCDRLVLIVAGLHAGGGHVIVGVAAAGQYR